MSTTSLEKHPKKHRQIDPVFKQLTEDLFARFKVGLQTQVEVNRLPLTIDALATVDNDEARHHLQQETPFFYFLRYNQIEFKGVNDPLTPQEYHRICGRTHLYLSEHPIQPDEMMVTIICANRPKKVLAYKKMSNRFKRLQPGYYRSASMPNIYLIVIRELLQIPQNYPLLLFTGDATQFRTYLEQMLSEGNVTFLPYAWRTQPEITQEVMQMKRRGSKMTYEESLQLLVQDFGDDMLPIFPIEKRLQGLDPAQRLQGLDPAQRLEGLTPEQILAGLAQKQILIGSGIDYLAQFLSVEQRKLLLDQLLQSLISGAKTEQSA